MDIMDVKKISDLGDYDFIWASPDCSPWSVTQIGRNWHKVTNEPKTEKARLAILVVTHTVNLLVQSGKPFALENPVGKLRKMDFMQNLNRQTVTYCQYGERRRKPTDIWTHGFDWVPRPMCKNGDKCHEAAPRGSKTETQGMK